MNPVTSGWTEVPAHEAEALLREDAEAATAGRVARDAPAVLDFLKRMQVEGKGSQTTNEICQGTNLSWRRVNPALETLKKSAIYIDTTTKKKGTKSSWAVYAR
jgi:predicted transcriptional regulator